MNKRADLIASAASAFDAGGFRGIGIDAVLAPSGISTRTLYKHFASRDDLVLAVLEARHRAFMDRLREGQRDADALDVLFDTLKGWLVDKGARGCLMLRARGEYAGANAAIVALVQQQKQDLLEDIGTRVEAVLGLAEADLAMQIWLLFEGATAVASVSGPSVVDAAKHAAGALVTTARRHAR